MELEKEQMQAKIKQLENELAAAKAKTKVKLAKDIELLVEYETGYLQIRRLMPRSVNLPTWVIRWILENAQQILQFIAANKSLLSEKDDNETQLEATRQNREEHLNNNPLTSIVRKPRAKSEPAF